MGLYVATTGTDVAIPELGFTLVHPSTDYDLTAQFTAEEIRSAESLTTAITTGVLQWRKVLVGGYETPSHYDPDVVEADELNLGDGAQKDRVVTFKDLTAYEQPKSGSVANTSFSGNPKMYSVTFGTGFADNNYSVLVSGTDVRSWSTQSKTANGFTINSNANQALTGSVHWLAAYHSDP